MPKNRKPPLPKRMSDDTVAFNNANDLLETLGVAYTRPSPTALKIGIVNYFPNTGTIHLDGHSKPSPKRGKDALRELLLGLRGKLNGYVKKRDAERRARDAAEIMRKLDED